MKEFVAKWGLLRAQLSSNGASIDEGLMVTIFVESFGDRTKYQFGTAFAALLTRDEVTWQSVTARLLQEYVSQQAMKTQSNLVKELAFSVQHRKGREEKGRKHNQKTGK